MKVVAVTFSKAFKRLTDAWEESVCRNLPGDIEVILVEPKEPEPMPGLDSFSVDNNYKLKIWRDFIKNSDEEIVCMDVDTIVLGDLKPAFNDDFDLAYTIRDNPHMRINAGVIFARPTEKTKAFMDRWVELDTKILTDSKLNEKGKALNYGQNQASLALLLQEKPDIKLKELPCEIWNCVDQNWHNFSEETKVLHIKGHLRECIITFKKPHQFPWWIQKAAAEFFKYDVGEWSELNRCYIGAFCRAG